ncbi:MAG TPA: hypothetical protein VK518_00125 [Puia sp.]|nr:hypothetical protein [Puia sp.]
MKKTSVLLCTVVSLLTTNCAKNLNDGASVSSPVSGKNSLSGLLSSPPGDIVGKITVGYQGWFSAAGDGSPINAWAHQNLENWPDIRQYTTTYSGDPFNQAGIGQPPFTGNLGNGLPAKMFSSDDQQVSNTHCLWMQQNGIDCFALQRFGSYTNPGSVKNFHDAVDLKMMNAAQTFGRKFYIMYDCSATDPVEADWTNTIISTQHLTSSPAYAHQNGKPVVCLWGVGKSGRGATADWVNTINWFKSQGLYVIGGPLAGFSTDVANQPAYNACDMIMPWMVGKTSNSNFQSIYTSDLAYCNAHGIDYQADIYPGTAFYNTNGASSPQNQIPRTHGDFMWSQFAAARTASVSSVYISMFDEMNEATGILNCAEDAGSIPAGKYFLTLDADGTHVSSDFYLRLVSDGGKMIKGQIALTSTHPTPHVLTPPVSLTPHVMAGASIQVNWSAVTDAPCYNLKRSTTNGGPYTTVAAGVPAGGFLDTGLTPGTRYYYVVTSGHINGGESGNSPQVSAVAIQ